MVKLHKKKIAQFLVFAYGLYNAIEPVVHFLGTWNYYTGKTEVNNNFEFCFPSVIVSAGNDFTGILYTWMHYHAIYITFLIFQNTKISSSNHRFQILFYFFGSKISAKLGSEVQLLPRLQIQKGSIRALKNRFSFTIGAMNLIIKKIDIVF